MGDRMLADLAGRIDEAHGHGKDGLRLALSGAVEAGRLLIEAEAQVSPGDWPPWVGTHGACGVRQALRSMRVARGRLEGTATSPAHETVEGMLRALAAPEEEPEETSPSARHEGRH